MLFSTASRSVTLRRIYRGYVRSGSDDMLIDIEIINGNGCMMIRAFVTVRA